MTVQNIIDHVDALVDNRYIDTQKRCWISEVDNKITREILPMYSESVPTFFPYTSNTDTVKGSQADLDMYVNYICYKMSLFNNEAIRANNHAGLFNTEYDEYKKAYMRTHKPITKRYRV